jgi:hypothetical protein
MPYHGIESRACSAHNGGITVGQGKKYPNMLEYWKNAVQPVLYNGTDEEKCRALTDFIATVYPFEYAAREERRRSVEKDGENNYSKEQFLAEKAYKKMSLTRMAATNLLRAIQLQSHGSGTFAQFETLGKVI